MSMTKGTPTSSQIVTLERMVEERDAALAAEREISDKLLMALKDIQWQVKKNSDADVIAESALAEVAAIRAKQGGQ